ncbi:molybdenum cofactor synthesis 2 [Rickenella mellea]|uniref:Molybdenum cofactor synthesis 2 n=1 Tax=Rickenella mellea TaxID=50990 RepID=A0A4Y7QMZ5_9AGAM|nr:molybdenum cofactor synthesis 2 [Rickenella mellea]
MLSCPPPSSSSARLTLREGDCILTYDPLDVSAIIKTVADDAAGATTVFIGTTRNSFNGRIVTSLEYHAYSKLAIKTMGRILQNTVAAFPSDSCSSNATSPLRAAIHHRLGVVGVGQPSVVIAVSAPHRKEAFQVCEHILEEVKQKVQIWKREFYVDDEAEWKANTGDGAVTG